MNGRQISAWNTPKNVWWGGSIIAQPFLEITITMTPKQVLLDTLGSPLTRCT